MVQMHCDHLGARVYHGMACLVSSNPNLDIRAEEHLSKVESGPVSYILTSNTF